MIQTFKHQTDLGLACGMAVELKQFSSTLFFKLPPQLIDGNIVWDDLSWLEESIVLATDEK